MSRRYLIRCVDANRTTMTAEPLPLEVAEAQALRLQGRGRGVRCEVVPAAERAGGMRLSDEIKADRRRRSRCETARAAVLKAQQRFVDHCQGGQPLEVQSQAIVPYKGRK